MSLARHGRGPVGAVRALSTQVHPVFMLPPVALSVLGSALAAEFSAAVAAVHATAIFLAVYTAHVKDGYVDFYLRGEDDDHPLTAAGCRVALAGATAGFLACAGVLWLLAGPVAAALVAPTWLLGYFHAPTLDTNPVTTTLGYPLGNALALAGAAVAQAGTLAPEIGGLAAVLLVLLAGVKVVDDAQDYAYDRSIDKRTVAVALGLERGRRLGFALLGLALALTVGFAAAGVLPTGAVLGAFAFGAVAAVASGRSAEVATMLLIRGGYVFLALVVLAIWARPMTGPPPVDVGVLGGYTYLATELLFGGVAAALLVRAGALARALRTVAVIYPVAYLWDWYTLRVGVFSIPLRTGVEVLGIPLEEHLFMVVVPAFVLAVHETRLRGRARGRAR
ncbi:MAG: lycopene cyclase [Haloferacaceae archaeon]